MRIATLELLNFMRYRGNHMLTFEGKAYGIVARRMSDADSSNWCGKTTLLEAIAFALYGWHRHRTEDAWITQGESRGGVVARLTDGTQIERTRNRGKSTQLVVHIDGRKSAGEEAQRLLIERIGLSEADFFATCFFHQKQIARFVTARPADRMAIVAEWLELNRLRKAEQWVREKLADVTRGVAIWTARLDAALLQVTEHIRTHGEVDAIDLRIAQLEEAHVDASADFEAAKAAAKAYNEHSEARMAAVRLQEVRAELATAEAESRHLRESRVQARATEAARLEKEAWAEANAAQQETRRKETLARGKFNGVCPVGGQQCPVTDELNANHETNLVILDACLGRQIKAERKAKEMATASAELAKLLTKYNVMRERIETLRKQEERYKAVKFSDAPVKPPPQDSHELYAEVAKIGQQIAQAREALSQLRTKQQAVETITIQLEPLRAELTTYREALAILGRNGAQRRIAEDALTEIAQGANERLQRADIDLGVEITWGREAKGLATTCEACGQAFPASQKVRECAGCGEPRGPKVEERLDVELTDRSGGAEDLAGLAIQLAAGAWLRRQRDAAWSVVCIDEPYGALDGAHRRALSTHLATLLGGHDGYEQAFVIAHSNDVIEALPGRIVVTAEGKESCVAVG